MESLGERHPSLSRFEELRCCTRIRLRRYSVYHAVPAAVVKGLVFFCLFTPVELFLQTLEGGGSPRWKTSAQDLGVKSIQTMSGQQVST